MSNKSDGSPHALEVGGVTITDDSWCVCGHHKQHHKTLGGVTVCNAVIKRVIGETILCDCKKFEVRACQ
jgi:hypothetical protein